MKLFANHVKSYRRTRHSFCSRMLKAFALMFAMVGLAQAEATEFACFQPEFIDPGSSAARIRYPGEYVLTEDCVVEDGIDGISITASDVQLNLDGHTISGPGCGPGGTGITVFGSKVHVTGGTVKGFAGGVKVRPVTGSAEQDRGSADHNHLSDLTVTENCNGIELRFSDNNHVNFNKVSKNFGTGLEVDSSHNNQIEFNVINQNRHGIFVSGSDSNVLAFNTISRNVNGGVTLDPADGQVGGSNNNTIASNVVTETKEFPGITVRVGKGNTINGNLSSRNDMGIVLEARASGNFVLRNTALRNTREDLSDLNCGNNKWRGNIFKTKKEDPPVGCIE